jgi:hypothetical protein
VQEVLEQKLLIQGREVESPGGLLDAPGVARLML